MSHENVERTHEAVRALDEGGVDALVPYLEPDVEWHPPAESMEPGTYRGHDGVRDYLGRLRDIFEEQRVELLDVIEVDDNRVLAVVRVVGRSEKFGTEIDAEWAWLITEGATGKAGRVETFTDKTQALEAAGLSE